MRQFVIQLANRPGELAHLSRALASRGIDIETISCAGAGSTACAFVVPSDPQAMREVLHGLGHPYVEGNAIVVSVADEPGGLASVAERLAAANVNILGALVVGRRNGKVDMAFTVDDEAKARGVLGLVESPGLTH